MSYAGASGLRLQRRGLQPSMPHTMTQTPPAAPSRLSAAPPEPVGVITGASSGIGHATAPAWAGAGGRGLVLGAGLEPARITPTASKTVASANFATRALKSEVAELQKLPRA